MKLKPNLHDAETLAAVFAAGMTTQLASSQTFDRSVIYSAVIAGLSAVVHKYATAPVKVPTVNGNTDDPTTKG